MILLGAQESRNEGSGERTQVWNQQFPNPFGMSLSSEQAGTEAKPDPVSLGHHVVQSLAYLIGFVFLPNVH